MKYFSPFPAGRLALVVLSGLVIGCSSDAPPLAQVKGKVTVRDRPIRNATVLFVPEKGPMATGQTDADGNYVLKTGDLTGVALGKSKVAISKVISTPPAGPMKPEDMMNMQKASEGKKQETPLTEISSRYANPDSSGLEVSVTSDSSKNVFDFKLSD